MLYWLRLTHGPPVRNRWRIHSVVSFLPPMSLLSLGAPHRLREARAQERGGRGGDDGACYSCGKPGHLARDCPSGDRGPPSRRGGGGNWEHDRFSGGGDRKGGRGGGRSGGRDGREPREEPVRNSPPTPPWSTQRPSVPQSIPQTRQRRRIGNGHTMLSGADDVVNGSMQNSEKLDDDLDAYFANNKRSKVRSFRASEVKICSGKRVWRGEGSKEQRGG
jgi:hypothetical protein